MKTPDYSTNHLDKTKTEAFDEVKYNQHVADYQEMVQRLTKEAEEDTSKPENGIGHVLDDTPAHRLEDAITIASEDINNKDINLARASWDVFYKNKEEHGNVFIMKDLFGRMENEEMKEYIASKIDIQSVAERIMSDKEWAGEDNNRRASSLHPEAVVLGLKDLISKSSKGAQEILQQKLEEFKEIMKKNDIIISQESEAPVEEKEKTEQWILDFGDDGVSE